MASILEKVFSTYLLKEPVKVPDENFLPSPNKVLKNIIIKNKKLDKNEETEEATNPAQLTPYKNVFHLDFLYFDRIYLRDQQGQWKPFIGILTKDMLFIYIEDMEFRVMKSQPGISVENSINENKAAELEAIPQEQAVWSILRSFNQPFYYKRTWEFGKDALYYPYFYGDITPEMAKEWAFRCMKFGQGAYALFASSEFSNVLKLFVVFNDDIRQLNVNFSPEKGYSLECTLEEKKLYFPTLECFVKYYKKYPVHGINGEKIHVLMWGIPEMYFIQPYFHKFYSKAAAHFKLSQIDLPGTFLFWAGGKAQNDFEPVKFYISYVNEKSEVKHEKIKIKDQTYNIRNQVFLYLDMYMSNQNFWYPMSDQSEAFITKINQAVKQSVLTGMRSIYNGLNPGSFPDVHTAEVIEEQIDDMVHFSLKTEKSQFMFGVHAKNAQKWREGLRIPVNYSKKSGDSSKSTTRIAPELSDLVVYCQSKSFSPENTEKTPKIMSSFSEKTFASNADASNIAKRIISDRTKKYSEYCDRHFARIYPAGLRFDSSNYDPITPWAVGAQMVALNFQTPTRSMHLNDGRFIDNGKCGYVLRTSNPRNYSPDLPLRKISLEIVAGFNLPYTSDGILEVEFVGEPWEQFPTKAYRVSLRGNVIMQPVQLGLMKFETSNVNFSLVRFIYSSSSRYHSMKRTEPELIKTIQGDINESILVQTCLPIHALLCNELKMVQMKNAHNTVRPLCHLLVRVYEDQYPVLNYSNMNQDFFSKILSCTVQRV